MRMVDAQTMICLIAVIFTWLLPENAAVADPATEFSVPVVLVVHQDTPVQQTVASEPATQPPILKRGTIVVGLRQGTSEPDGQISWLVAERLSQEPAGWVDAAEVTPLSDFATTLSENAYPDQHAGTATSSTLPELIAMQENPTIRDAWQRIAKVVAENDQLSATERMPEPYFARAEIWFSVNDYFAAMQDYLTGIQAAKTLGRDVNSYAKELQRLSLVAEKLAANPVPMLGSADSPRLAEIHYGLGLNDFFAGQYTQALEHFSNSIALDPRDCHYWYFRALTHRAMGDFDRAQHDALLGARFEKRASTPLRVVNVRLTRIQGEPRTWLEKYRSGLITYHLVGTTANSN